MIDFGFNPVSKPDYERNKPKRGKHTAITDKCSTEVHRRSSELNGCITCELCGTTSPRIRFERAHLVNASQYGSGNEPWNIADVCGPKTDTGTCHQIIDETALGKRIKQQKRIELIEYYKHGEGKKYWKYTEE
ncbi:hypothetical protein J2T12_005068 [Paenibacillus anaericanus]|uniref:hypothetical protein n=1 Tax=Paenibacillus anaericanus TaxID=170367 RepID=UPI002780E6A5|nr:hypothetical protein [Paenibacillus anaericanus]MDQ0091628.1 hypothetical protein [Paenibacillus anaericanus]